VVGSGDVHLKAGTVRRTDETVLRSYSSATKRSIICSEKLELLSWLVVGFRR
jgi:hypothetical protein